MKKTAAQKGNPELIEALNAIEKEKDISKEILKTECFRFLCRRQK